MKDIELQISQFIDQELSDTEQRELFTVLSEDEKARRVLSDFMQIKKNTSDHYSNITTNLSQVQIPQPQIKNLQEPSSKYRTMFYFSLAASIVLAMILVWNLKEKQNSLVQFSSLEKQYTLLKNEYTKVISMKRIETEAQRIPILVKSTSKKRGDRTISTPTNPIIINTEQSRRLRQSTEMMQVNRVSITKDDFIGGQIVGN